MKVELRIKLDAKVAADAITALLKVNEPSRLYVSDSGGVTEYALAELLRELVKAVKS